MPVNLAGKSLPSMRSAKWRPGNGNGTMAEPRGMGISLCQPQNGTEDRSEETRCGNGRDIAMGLTKRELEDLNEGLQEEIARLRAENAELMTSLASATGQYKDLSERTEKLERRYRRLRGLLNEHLGAIER